MEFLKYIDEDYKKDMVEFARKLISTPSISRKEKAVADLYLNEMEKLGYDEVFRDDMGNVVGIVNGSEDGPSIMYNSHMDHVSAGNKENWEGYDPYGAKIDICEVDDQYKTKKEKAECIHGRGASDVKGGAAVQVYAGGILAKLKKQGVKFKGKFIFTGVVQEEPASMIGTIHLLDKTFKQKGLKYDAMVTSEASSLKLYLGHRGRIEFLVTVHGRTSHGSAPWLGINAVYKAIPFINKIKDELDKSLPTDEDIGPSAITLTIIDCLPGELSIVPDTCRISLDRRLTPGETIEEATKQIQDIIDECHKEDPEFSADVEIKATKEVSYTGVEYYPEKTMAAWKIPKDHPVVLKASEALKEIGQDVSYGYWDFGTDASKTAGIDKIPTIGYSPMQEQYAHTPYDKVRTDFMYTALEGNIAIFLKLADSPKETFVKLK